MGHHLPPIIVLLTSSVRGGNAQPLKLQALEGWRALVKALAKHSPSQLSDVANQVPLQLRLTTVSAKINIPMLLYAPS